MNFSRTAFLTGVLLLAGCAGRVDYTPPSYSSYATDNSILIDSPKEEVWSRTVPAISSSFFVINNIDKESGLINISFSADPEKYVDCGMVESYVKNARGERTYRFPASRKSVQYEVMSDGALYRFNRSMSLDGRINLVLEETSERSTKVTANTRYTLTRGTQVASAAGGMPASSQESISFSSGETQSFPANSDGKATTCIPNGLLEEALLSSVSG